MRTFLLLIVGISFCGCEHRSNMIEGEITTVETIVIKNSSECASVSVVCLQSDDGEKHIFSNIPFSMSNDPLKKEDVGRRCILSYTIPCGQSCCQGKKDGDFIRFKNATFIDPNTQVYKSASDYRKQLNQPQQIQLTADLESLPEKASSDEVVVARVVKDAKGTARLIQPEKSK